MTPYEKYNLLISAVGLVVIVGSLVLVFVQTRTLATQTKHLADATKLSTYQSIITQIFEMDKILISKPHLHKYFHYNVDIDESNADFDIAILIADMHLDCFDTLLTEMTQFPQIWPGDWWMTYIVDTFRESPLLCRHLRFSVRSWYSEELYTLMEKGERIRSKELSQKGAAIPKIRKTPSIRRTPPF